MSKYRREGRAPFWLTAAIAVALLIGAGFGYRAAAKALQRKPVSLPVPLSAIPTQIAGWTGQDVFLDTTTAEYMKANFADDYVSRHYVSKAEEAGADVYMVYCSSRRAGLLGHRPGVCFPAHGWVHAATTEAEVTLRSGRRTACLIHRFQKTWPAYTQVYVLSFYVLNGRITLQESDFSGFFDRIPNIDGDPAQYVAQVQISASLERSCRLAARDLVDTLLLFLPGPDGRVEAAAQIDQAAPEQVDDVND